MDLNIKLFNYLYSFAHRSNSLDSAIIFFASDFALLSGFALLYFLYNHKDRKRGLKEIAVVLASALVAWVLAHFIKDLFQVPRPDNLHGVTSLINYGKDIYTFPSGHATFFSALALSIYFYHRKLGYFFAICALIIGVARVASGLHFPMDVVSGYLLGILIALFVYILIQKKPIS